MPKLRVATAPLLGLALMLATAGAVALSVSPLVSKASAYVLANGCDEYDPDRGLYYWCTPDRSAFYTPDGVDPNWVPVGAGYSSAAADGPEMTSFDPEMTYYDSGGIPPPAPYRPGRDYCSNSWLGWSAFEGIWQYSCYEHDVCYGSQLGRKYCDAQFWHHMIGACKSNYSWYNPTRYGCFADAVDWYWAVRWFGGGHYVPRQTSFEPAGD